MKIKIDPSSYSSSFHNVLHSWDRYLIAWGGRGSSKTDTFYLKWLASLFEPYYFKLAYINKEASSIRDQQYAGFKRVAKRVGLYQYLRFYDGDYRIVNPKSETDNMLIPKGMDDPEKTKGLDDVTAIWWDEINKGELSDYSALNELLRSPNAMFLQFALSFNPVSENHWLRHEFFHPDDKYRLHPNYHGQAYLHHSTYLDNEFIDQEAYLKTLIQSAAGSQNRINVNVKGLWGHEENNHPWLYAFKYEKHVRTDVQVKPERPVYLSFDFNNDPVACTAWQFSDHMGDDSSYITCVAEFVGVYKIEDLCERIRTFFPYSVFHVTGDRSGRNKDLGRNETLYDIICRLLGVRDRLLDTPQSNLSHHDSRILCNTIFEHYPHVSISHTCTNLLNDCEVARVVDKNNNNGGLEKDRKDYKMDAFDSMRYFFQTYFLDYISNKFRIYE